MNWLMMHVAFGQIAQGAGANAGNDQSTSAAAQMGTVADSLAGAKADEAVAAYYDRFWAEQSKTRDLKSQTGLFISLTATGSRVYLMSKARDAAKVDVSTVKRVYGPFLQNTSDSLVAKFVRDAEKGLEIWQEVLKDWFRLLQDKTLKEFRQRVESGLLDAYIARAAKELREKMGGVPHTKLSEHVDTVRGIIRDHSSWYSSITVGPVTAWKVPLVPPERWPTVLSIGSEISGGVSGILLLPALATGPAVIAVAVVLLVAEKAGAIGVAWKDLKDKEEQYRQTMLSDALKDALRTGFEQQAYLIRTYQDLLAVPLAVGAIKAGLDFSTEAQEPIRAYLWQQLFKDFPEDPTASQQKISQGLETNFRKLLTGS